MFIFIKCIHIYKVYSYFFCADVLMCTDIFNVYFRYFMEVSLVSHRIDCTDDELKEFTDPQSEHNINDILVSSGTHI